MRELVVFVFEDEDGAEQHKEQFSSAQASQHLTLNDAALVKRRPVGRAALKHATDLVSDGDMGAIVWGSFWR